MATTEQFSLRWNNFHSNLTAGFHELLEASEMVDVTLAVDGHFLQAHKIVLSICSPLFKQMFKVNPCKHPIVILKDIGHDNMKNILEFMYMGEVNVLRENLSTFLRTAELLQVKGLTGDDSSDTSSRKDEKCDSLPDHDDDTDLLQLNQYIDSDLELPTHYSTPQQQQQQQQQRFTPIANKRSSKNQQSNCKRTKNETNVKCENDTTSTTTTTTTTTTAAIIKQNDESNYIDDIKIEKNSSETEDNVKDNSTLGVPGSNDTNANEDVLLYSVDQKGHVYCPYCCRKFVNRYNLKVHIRDKHEDSPIALDCRICGKVMRNRSCLRVHMYHHRKQQLEPRVM